MGSSILSEDGLTRRPLPLTPACVELDAKLALTNEITEQVSEAKRKKITQARELRSTQRRFINELGTADLSDLLKINQLEVWLLPRQCQHSSNWTGMSCHVVAPDAMM